MTVPLVGDGSPQRGSQWRGCGGPGRTVARRDILGMQLFLGPAHHRQVQASEPDREIEQADSKIDGHKSTTLCYLD